MFFHTLNVLFDIIIESERTTRTRSKQNVPTKICSIETCQKMCTCLQKRTCKYVHVHKYQHRAIYE